MIKRTIFIISFIILASSPGAMAGEQEDRLYNSLMKETASDEKRKLAEQLGRLGTADAKAKLIRLLNDSSSWNRRIAVKGLFLLPGGAGPELFERMQSDNMIDDDIAEGFSAHIGAYQGFLAEKYRSLSNQKERELIISIIASGKKPQGEAFLKGIIEDEGSGDRECAFRNLAVHFPSGNYRYIKSRRDIPAFRVHALTYCAERGTPEDLAIFRDVIDKKEEAKCRLVAYKAVNRWGDDALKHRVFLDSLGEQDENLAQGGIYVFTGVGSDAIRKALCRLAKKGKYQVTRMAAARRLKEYTAPDIIPALVVILRENYVPRERGGADIFATIITFGITSVFDDISQKRQRSSFESGKKEIAGHLRKITGADNGDSYSRWYEWAILNGHTILGDNIIRHLFSGYRSRREKAVEPAIRLLGYPSGRDFFSKNGTFSSDIELSLALARMLIAKGFLKDED
ncbi:MAG: HEAT repeat domain-containing protein [Spirochaetes bacterium]|nr:HEAT repeat domain-containing protein [Spirochaetota bacterium]